MKKTPIATRLALLWLALLGLLSLTAVMLAVLMTWLIYVPLPGIVKAGLGLAGVLALVGLPMAYARWRRDRRRRDKVLKTVTEALDFSDEMMETLELPRLSSGQRDVLRGTLDALLEDCASRQEKK